MKNRRRVQICCQTIARIFYFYTSGFEILINLVAKQGILLKKLGFGIWY